MHLGFFVSRSISSPSKNCPDTFACVTDLDYSLLHTVTVTTAVAVLAEAVVNTWLWFKVLQVDLILVFSDVLMPPHHHNRKLELRKNTNTNKHTRYYNSLIVMVYATLYVESLTL